MVARPGFRSGRTIWKKVYHSPAPSRQEALNYIAYKKFNPDAAESLQDDIEAMGRSLVEYPGKYPGKYPFVPDEVLRNWGIRFVMVKEYYMFYTIRGNTIYFVRFLHRRRDWFSILRTGIGLE